MEEINVVKDKLQISKKSLLERKDIKGWGVDADTKNDPTYPIKHRTNEEHDGYNWKRPSQQPINIEVLHSNERPNVTAVFGTSVPPSGLSGMIRRLAFRYGEGSFAHWIPLILADRVNVVEGVVDDLLHGHVPNIFAEKGMKAQWKYDQKGVVKSLAVGALLTTAALTILLRNK
jgi:hypothetical protein